jgi:ubiquinone/menaquinone biosynthesis C-methylase UbiE
MAVRKTFDGISFLDQRGKYTNVWQTKLSYMESIIRGKKVLDAGCGRGDKMCYFSGSSEELIGVDVDIDALQLGRKKDDSQAYIGADVQGLPFKDNSFDVVYSTWVVEHLKEPKLFIQEVNRVLKKDGILILWVPNVKCPEGLITKIIPFQLKEKILKLLLKTSEVSPHKCYYRANSVRKLDMLCQGKLERIRLERFDKLGYFKNSRILTYLWLLRDKLTNNDLLRWCKSEFYVEYQKQFR